MTNPYALALLLPQAGGFKGKLPAIAWLRARARMLCMAGYTARAILYWRAARILLAQFRAEAQGRLDSSL
jgi:hypothetical protein